ncbi:MAG: type 1 glutamine amidotransferase [Burkholderiales bacterium]|nr:type 1 glutamine amidotransferase [Burkholderiales bacterium]
MKPVLILQHLSSDGPAYLGTWLSRHGIPHEVRDTEAGDPYPESMDAHAALAVLGGEMSANDPLPSLRRAEALILDAVARSRPVIGHCLGGQLMARALGGRVQRSPAPEVGWQPLQVHDHAEARHWFGETGSHHVFHWHEEAFELPPGATALARSEACPHQAFAIGPHLGLQFHVEIDEEKLRRWSRLDTPAYREAQRRHPSVQSGAQMCADLPLRLPAHQALADRLYAQWWRGVAAAG